MTERQFYGYRLRLEAVDRWVIWHSDEGDGVLTDGRGSVLGFATFGALKQYVLTEGIVLARDPDPEEFLDLDPLVEWLSAPRPDGVDCVLFLNAWNMFGDVAGSVGVALRDRGELADRVHDKLFWGNNLPAVTPKRHSYQPVWSANELDCLCQTLDAGLAVLRSALLL